MSTFERTELIFNRLTNFAWWNYGLDSVGDARSDDWARDLAAEIDAALNPPEEPK
jgi:hypothetical protein